MDRKKWSRYRHYLRRAGLSRYNTNKTTTLAELKRLIKYYKKYYKEVQRTLRKMESNDTTNRN